jgi:cation:H+ antiporter
MSQWLIAIGLVVLGLLFLYYGAEWLVSGSSQLAVALGVRPFIVGVTVVAFGTSSPELLVAAVASAQDKPQLVLGNILGSNMANIGLILGVSAVIAPLRISLSIFRAELPMVIASVALFYVLALNGLIGRFEGIGLLVVLAAFTIYYWFKARRETAVEDFLGTSLADQKIPEKPPARKTVEDRAPSETHIPKAAMLVFAGILVLLGGAEALVRGSVHIARSLGVSEAIIGFSLVALGTSLPEMATSLVAAARKETDLCIGNVVGSNIMNVLLIGGVGSIIVPMPVAARQLSYDFPAVVILSALLLPFMRTGYVLSRLEGVALLAAYGVYLYLLFHGYLGPVCD